jgi:phosphatidate cytidylyltransferase
MSNLAKRFLTGLIAGTVVISGIVLTDWAPLLFCTLVTLVGLHEFYRIVGVKSVVSKWFLIGVAGLVWAYWAWEAWAKHAYGDFPDPLFVRTNLMAIGGSVIAIAAVLLLWEKRVEQPAQEAGLLGFGYLYIVIPLSLLYQIGIYSVRTRHGEAEYHFEPLLGTLFLTWFLDTFAYFGGRFLGKRKLWERISPKKTWEGAIIGGAFCIGLSCVLEFWLCPMEFSWIVVGVITAIFGQLGDLVESMYKRGLQIKDSGGILPGHGGILDRFDGLLICTPLIYLYIQWTIWS